MTFEEWMDSGAHYYIAHVEDAKKAWEAAWDQQQRVIDEMHLQFKYYKCPECGLDHFRHKMDCGKGR